MRYTFAMRSVLVVAPSPLAGEGSSGSATSRDRVRGLLRQKPSYEDTPSANLRVAQFRVALFRKGRGHRNVRRRLPQGPRR